MSESMYDTRTEAQMRIQLQIQIVSHLFRPHPADPMLDPERMPVFCHTQ